MIGSSNFASKTTPSYDMQEILRAEDCTLSHVLVHQILREEGFAKLPRRRDDERPTVIRPEVAEVADVRQLDWEDFENFETQGSALFVLPPRSSSGACIAGFGRLGYPAPR